MFVRYYLELPLPFEQVESAVLRTPEEWVPGLARGAGDRAEVLLGEVGFGAPGRRVEKQVQIELGPPVRFPSKTVLPMRWRPTGSEALFPSLEADIEVAGLGPHRTQLSVSAQYRPPLGMVGRAIDRTLLHRVAEATMKDFVDGMGEAVKALTRLPAHAG